MLTALLEDRLYSRTADNKIFIVKTTEGDLPAYALVDPLSGADAGGRSARLPGQDRQQQQAPAIAQDHARTFRTLESRSPRYDSAPIQDMLRRSDEPTVELLRERKAVETDQPSRRRSTPVSRWPTSTEPTPPHGSRPSRCCRAALDRTCGTSSRRLRRNPPTARFVEADADSQEPRQQAPWSISTRIAAIYSAIETLFFGLSLGSVLVLIAIGLAITFGVMGVINMAHGELMMLGAYTTYLVQVAMPRHQDASILVAIPAAFLTAGAVGVLIERTIIRFLYGRPLETLLATFGLSLVLQQLVRSMFSALNRSVATPSWMSGTLQINEALGITYNRLYIVFFTLIVFSLLLAVLKRTRLGLDIRAVSQNRAMARAMGVRSDRVDAMTFGLGAGIAGVAGVALSQLTNVGPNLGQAYIIDSFMVVVFGGVGNLWGTLIGGMSLGIVNKLLEPYSGAVLAKIFVLVALILFIQRRPRGLFPQTGRAAESQ